MVPTYFQYVLLKICGHCSHPLSLGQMEDLDP